MLRDGWHPDPGSMEREQCTKKHLAGRAQLHESAGAAVDGCTASELVQAPWETWRW